MIPAAQAPRDPLPQGSDVYFAMAGSDKIVRFDAPARRFQEWPVLAGSRPHGLAVATDGTIYYAGFGDGTIGELDPRTGLVLRHALPQADSRPYSVTLDGQGNVWATLRAGAIAMLDTRTHRVTEYKMDGEPYGLAFDRNGTLWVTCIAADRLRSFDPKTGVSTEIAFDKGSRPRRAVLAPDGRIWVSLYGSGRIAVIDPATAKVVKTYPTPGGPNAGPYAVAAGRDGRIWVTEFQTDTIAILEPAQGAFEIVRLPARSAVRNAALDSQGRLWFISSRAGKIGVIQ